MLVLTLLGAAGWVEALRAEPKPVDSAGAKPTEQTAASAPARTTVRSGRAVPATQPNAPRDANAAIPEPRQAGGEPDGIVQVANLVYAGTKSSQCFSDHFLVQAEKDSTISTSRRFHAVKLDSDELFEFPLVIMTGEGSFQLPDAERENLRRHVERGGFLLASAGCSSQEWDRSFRAELERIFPANPLKPIGMDHPVFHTVYEIRELRAKHGEPRPVEGASFNGRLGVLYAPDGLNDTAHAQGCCCCGGDEITNAVEVNVNILAYALTH